MKRYFEHMQSKPTHERRKHAAQMAGVVTMFVFLGWLATLGYRFTSTNTQVASDTSQTQQTQLAGVLGGSMAPQGGATLEVATTSYIGQ